MKKVYFLNFLKVPMGYCLQGKGILGYDLIQLENLF